MIKVSLASVNIDEIIKNNIHKFFEEAKWDKYNCATIWFDDMFLDSIAIILIKIAAT